MQLHMQLNLPRFTGIYRISVAVPPMPGVPDGFTFNQFLVVDDKPLLFHTGMKVRRGGHAWTALMVHATPLAVDSAALKKVPRGLPPRHSGMYVASPGATGWSRWSGCHSSVHLT
jgi:hypothetical protein